MKMHWNTVSKTLRQCLEILMASAEFKEFRLVGGTALSLHLGHRMSVDIDLFTDADYGSIDFKRLEDFLKGTFPYVDPGFGGIVGMGKSYLIGNSKENNVKLDIYYSNDPFIQDAVVIDGVRMATVEEIIAMKVDVVSRGGRKKDFWDLHEVLEQYDIAAMMALHQQRSEYTHDPELIVRNFTDFDHSDDDLDPICLKGKHWIFIKEDFEEAMTKHRSKE